VIKIAFIIDTIESPTAGTEKQLLMLIKHLDRSKFQPYLCVLRSSQWLEKDFADCELVDMGVSSFGRLTTYRNIWLFVQYLKKNCIDIVQTHFKEGNWVGVVAAYLASTKIIISTRRNQGYWYNAYKLSFLRILNKCVTYFIANCVSTRDWAANVEGIDLSRIAVIHNGLDIELYKDGTEKEKRSFKRRNGFPMDAVVIGIIANLRPVKAIDVFISAAEITFKNNQKVRFIIVGDGPEKNKLEAMVIKSELGEVVRFLGKRQDIPELLSCIDIGALTSSSESFSNSIVEYLAAGKTVVCTDVGGAREAVADEINGYLVKPGDPSALSTAFLKALASNRISMGYASRKLAIANFSLKSMMKATEQFYIEAISKTGGYPASPATDCIQMTNQAIGKDCPK